MARLANARNNHMTRWVIPAAKRLLIGEACKTALTQPLSEVAHIEMGQSPVGESSNDNGDGIPLIGGPADLGLEFPQATRWTNAPTKLCELGDIIVCVRATIGEPRWANGVYCLGRGVAGIRPIDKNLLPKFLFFIIEGNEQMLRSMGTGTTFKTISKQHLASIQVPMIPIEEQEIIVSFLAWLEQNNNTRPNFLEAPGLPGSLTNQRWVVARIEELAAKIEEARGLRREIASTINAVYASISSTLVDPYSGSWQREKVSDVILSIDAGWSPQCEDHPATDHEWGVLKTTAVQWGEFRPYENKALPRIFVPKPELSIASGDVLVTRAGPRKRVGVVASVTETQKYLMISDKLIRLKPDLSKIESRFLEISLSTSFSQEYLVKRKTGLADAQVNISQAILLSTPIAYPSLSEQRQIINYLDKVKEKLDSLKQLQSETSAELDALLPSILNKAFKGELS